MFPSLILVLDGTRLKAIFDTVQVTRIYMGVDTHFCNNKMILDEQFLGGTPLHVLCSVSSSFFIIDLSVIVGLVVLFCMFGSGYFNIYTGLYFVLDVNICGLVLLSTVVCAPVANTRHGSVGKYFRQFQ